MTDNDRSGGGVDVRAMYELESPRGVDCPTCGAKTGARCRRSSGTRYPTYMHLDRLAVYNRRVDERIRLARYADYM